MVTVVTPTFRRPQAIAEYLIPSIECQAYSPVEHLVVIDGQDPESVKVLQDHGYSFDDPYRRITYLGRNWTSFSGDGGLGMTARLVGSWMAAGDYIAYLDDDNRWLPHHLETLVRLLESENADFVTGSWTWEEDGRRGGWSPPGFCRTDASAILCRAEVLKKGMSCSWYLDGDCGEGLLMDRWIAAGCTWAHNEEPTFIYPRARHGAPDE
jgi:glycosyltransferase involved in cell wall biosynthesis